MPILRRSSWIRLHTRLAHMPRLASNSSLMLVIIACPALICRRQLRWPLCIATLGHSESKDQWKDSTSKSVGSCTLARFKAGLARGRAMPAMIGCLRLGSLGLVRRRLGAAGVCLAVALVGVDMFALLWLLWADRFGFGLHRLVLLFQNGPNSKSHWLADDRAKLCLIQIRAKCWIDN